MSKKAWIIFAVLTIGIFALLVVCSNSTKVNISSIDENAIQVGNAQNGNIADHVFGKIDSKVTLIEYGDYQCPGCGAEHVLVKAILDTYKDKIRYVFRNFPLTSIHPNAKAASATVEAAGLQNKYWEMHNKVYEAQSAWVNLLAGERDSLFTTYAKDLGLDMDKFKTDIVSKEINNKINYDTAIARKLNINGTPSFYLNGTAIKGETWGDDAKFRAAIDSELTKNNIALPKPNN
ncbi:MAG: thioredoxin domain-containing protein [Candidatus Saccharimonadales bacterium]